MENFLSKKISEATFSSPIRIIGFDKLPKVGKPFITFESKKEAEEYIFEEKEKDKKIPIKKYNTDTSAEDVETNYLRIMIKTEAAGSIHAVEHEIEKIKSDKVKIKIIGAGIGNISENDVKQAFGKNHAVILGFDVGIDSSAKDLAERSGIEIHTFNIIYKIAEWLEEQVTKRTPKVMVEEVTAEVKVLKVFSSMKDKHVIGARVEKGTVFVGEDAKIMRKDTEIGRGKIRNLQREKNKVDEVREGVEFGCQLQSEVPPAPGDKLHLYKVMEK
jgi:translation initiation factor IF-2